MHEISVNIVDFGTSLIQNHSAHAGGSPEDTNADNPSKARQGLAAVPGCPSVLMGSSSPVTAPHCRGHSVPGW